MGQVVANASMSLDGYIAKQDNTIGRLFDWLQNGEVEVPTVDDRITLHMGPASAEYWHRWVDGLGALVCGRTLFDVTGGWGGMHTIGVPVVVVTHQVPTDWVEAHPDAPFHFVTSGVEAAVAKAQEIAGERTVAVTAGTIAGQCLELGLLDVAAIDLVPVVMGEGRPFFGEMKAGRCSSGRPDRVPPGRSRHPPPVPGDRIVGTAVGGARMRTLHIGLRVGDLDRSLGFYGKVGYDVVGTVPETEFGSLTMLKLPTDPFVSLELVHDPDAGTISPGGLNHLVIQVEDMHDTVTRLAAAGVEASEPSSPGRLRELLDRLAHRSRRLPDRARPVASRSSRRHDRC